MRHLAERPPRELWRRLFVCLEMASSKSAAAARQDPAAGQWNESTGEITRLLQAWSRGDEDAGDQLVPRIYAEMRKIAAGNLALERRFHTLQPTELVNETFVRLLGHSQVCWQSRAHFFASAARVVRRLLVEHARRSRTLRRGAGQRPRPLAEVADFSAERPAQLVELDEALCRLQQTDQDLAEIVEYRFFGGLTGAEIAAVLGLSTATVQRRWQLARGWLHRELRRETHHVAG